MEGSMICGTSILVPVEHELFARVVSFYGTDLALPTLACGESRLGNPWQSFQAPGGLTITIHTGRDGRFPYPEFRPSGHGMAFAFEVDSVAQALERLRDKGIEPLNRWDYGDGTQAISIADPAGNLSELWGKP
ncbi:VOC family protein [Pseudomonas sp. MBLB4123]|uniref:Glyoxalase/fosfomycin resistance/dioxygenase domain-containing protein n=1 Tax=Pseudomonas benzenivorans TaxID=556533 RepID=A0ABZ0PTK5_9PSED|nr:VOC family protein [Pseudomonas benzenivorans]WPC04485.1 hypothetical protein SBP02_17190 [Pseudomonas benzenivorans]